MTTITITATPSLEQWSEFVDLEQSKVKLAAFRAINKTVRWLRPTVSRQVAQELDIKVGLVRRSLQTKLAKRADLNAVVALPTKAGVIKAIDLGNARQTRRGVSVGKRRFDKAFIATMPSGHKGIYRRSGTSRLPINEIQLIITGKLAAALEDIADGPGIVQFQRLFQRELRFLTRA